MKSPVSVANNQYEQGSTNELTNASTSPMVCTFDLNKTNNNRNDKSKFKYVNNNNLMDVQANEK